MPRVRGGMLVKGNPGVSRRVIEYSLTAKQTLSSIVKIVGLPLTCADTWLIHTAYIRTDRHTSIQNIARIHRRTERERERGERERREREERDKQRRRREKEGDRWRETRER